MWICAGQKGHLVVKWKIGDVNCKSNCFLREEILGDWTPEHYITQLYLNLSVCEIGLSVGLEFQNLRSFWIYPALSSSDWEQKSVLKWLIKLFSSKLFWVELETSFLDSLTCLVPSLQSRGVVPNNAQGKTKMGKKKKKVKFWFFCVVLFRKVEYLCLVVRFQKCREGQVRPSQYSMCAGQEVWTTAFLPASVCDLYC